MYCTNCGNKLNDTDKFCVNCGEKRTIVENINVNNNNINNNNNGSNGLKIASIILGTISIGGSLLFIFAPFCFILSIIGLILGICALKKGKNVSGILLNSIGFVLSIIITIFIVLAFIFMFEHVDMDNYDYGDRINDYYNEYNHNKF